MAKPSRKDSTAQTAEGPMLVVALERYMAPEHRLVDDPLAYEFLPPASQRIVRACRFAPLRAALRGVSEWLTPGVWAGILCRKRAIDAALRQALDAGVASVVVLGAGLDTSACRRVAPAGRAGYELDLPQNVAMKRAAITRALGAVPEGVTLIGLDFEAEDIAAALAAAGFDFTAPALVVWEGVTQYLEPEAVRRTLAALDRMAPGSRLVFTYVLDDLISGAQMHGAEKLHRRFVEGYAIWKFGLSPTGAAALLDAFGWEIVDDAGAAEHAARFGIGPEAARRIMLIERVALARKRG